MNGPFMSCHTMKALMKQLFAYDINELCRVEVDTGALSKSVYEAGRGNTQ